MDMVNTLLRMLAGDPAIGSDVWCAGIDFGSKSKNALKQDEF
jgi:hypothetical protein